MSDWHRRMGYEHEIGLAGVDQLLGDADAVGGRGAAGISHADIAATVQTQNFRDSTQRHFQGDLRLRHGVGGDHRIDLVLVDACVAHRADTDIQQDIPAGPFRHAPGRNLAHTDDCNASFVHLFLRIMGIITLL